MPGATRSGQSGSAVSPEIGLISRRFQAENYFKIISEFIKIVIDRLPIIIKIENVTQHHTLHPTGGKPGPLTAAMPRGETKMMISTHSTQTAAITAAKQQAVEESRNSENGVGQAVVLDVSGDTRTYRSVRGKSPKMTKVAGWVKRGHVNIPESISSMVY